MRRRPWPRLAGRRRQSQRACGPICFERTPWGYELTGPVFKIRRNASFRLVITIRVPGHRPRRRQGRPATARRVHGATIPEPVADISQHADCDPRPVESVGYPRDFPNGRAQIRLIGARSRAVPSRFSTEIGYSPRRMERTLGGFGPDPPFRNLIYSTVSFSRPTLSPRLAH